MRGLRMLDQHVVEIGGDMGRCGEIWPAGA